MPRVARTVAWNPESAAHDLLHSRAGNGRAPPEYRAGDEVIVPSFTFPSAANAFVLRGARPIFVDVRPDTLNIYEAQIDQRITERTKAIFLVHYAGVGCEMDTVMTIARRHAVAVVEDNAHGLYGKSRGRYLGTFGELATLSFHETKNFSCGEGGALLINDAQFNQRAEILREKGTDRSRFFRGEVDKYTWVDIGRAICPRTCWPRSSAHNSNTAIRFSRGDNKSGKPTRASWLPGLSKRRSAPDRPTRMRTELPRVLRDHAVISQPAGVDSHLASFGILAVFHYLPLHLSPMGVRLGGRQGDCPVTEDLSDRLLRFPFFTGMSSLEQSQVIDAVRAFHC